MRVVNIGCYREKVGRYNFEVGVVFVDKNGKETKLPLTLCEDERFALYTEKALHLMFMKIKEELEE